MVSLVVMVFVVVYHRLWSKDVTLEDHVVRCDMYAENLCCRMRAPPNTLRIPPYFPRLRDTAQATISYFILSGFHILPNGMWMNLTKISMHIHRHLVCERCMGTSYSRRIWYAIIKAFASFT